MALCVETGGRLSEKFLKLIAYFASLSGTTESERRALPHMPYCAFTWYLNEELRK